MRWLLITLLACGCAQRDEVKSVIKENVSDTRTKPRVVVQIRSEDTNLRHDIEKKIEEQHVGTIKAEDSGPGHVDFTVEVDSTNDAIPRIRDLLRDAGALQQSTVRVSD